MNQYTPYRHIVALLSAGMLMLSCLVNWERWFGSSFFEFGFNGHPLMSGLLLLISLAIISFALFNLFQNRVLKGNGLYLVAGIFSMLFVAVKAYVSVSFGLLISDNFNGSNTFSSAITYSVFDFLGAGCYLGIIGSIALTGTGISRFWTAHTIRDADGVIDSDFMITGHEADAPITFESKVIKLHDLIRAQRKSILQSHRAEIHQLVDDLCSDRVAAERLILAYYKAYRLKLTEDLRGINSSYSIIFEYLVPFINLEIVEPHYPYDMIMDLYAMMDEMEKPSEENTYYAQAITIGEKQRIDDEIYRLYQLIADEKKRMLPPTLKVKIISLLRELCTGPEHGNYLTEVYEKTYQASLIEDLSAISSNDETAEQYQAALDGGR